MCFRNIRTHLSRFWHYSKICQKCTRTITFRYYFQVHVHMMYHIMCHFLFKSCTHDVSHHVPFSHKKKHIMNMFFLPLCFFLPFGPKKIAHRFFEKRRPGGERSNKNSQEVFLQFVRGSTKIFFGGVFKVARSAISAISKFSLSFSPKFP